MKTLFLIEDLNNSVDEAVGEIAAHPFVIPGLSDGGAHVGAICDVSLPTFMLTHWCRDRSRGPKLDLAEVVRSQTKDTAEAVGLLDRGVIKPGYLADLNVIDFDRLRESFEKGQKRTQTQKLRTAIERKLEELAALNPTRSSLVERFQELIAEYNAGSLNVERLFDALLAFVRDLDEEEGRAMIFGPTPLDEARGAILAHTVRLAGRVLKKGTVLDEAAIAALRAEGAV